MIKNTVNLIHTQCPFELKNIDEHDPEVFRMLSHGGTTGVEAWDKPRGSVWYGLGHTHHPCRVTDSALCFVTQFTMGVLEQLGLLKMDFLGLRNLTVIKNTVNRSAVGIPAYGAANLHYLLLIHDNPIGDGKYIFQERMLVTAERSPTAYRKKPQTRYLTRWYPLRHTPSTSHTPRHTPLPRFFIASIP